MPGPARRHDAEPDPRRIVTRRDFAHELTLARERAGLTVRDVARAAGVPDGTAGDYYAGRHLPPLRPSPLTGMLEACGVTDPEAVGRWFDALRRVRRTPGRRSADVPPPYRGLASFQPEDAEWFFGREDLTRVLVERLLGQRDTGGTLAVVGPSGSGKSSLLRAGLIPALREAGAGEWPCLLVTPGADPLAALAGRLATVAGTPEEEVRELRDALRDDPARAIDLAARARAASLSAPADDVRLVIVVDQFEEVFTGGCGEAGRRAFIAALRAVADGAEAPALVVIGLRADFYARALRHRRLAAVLQTAQVVVGPMSNDELRRAIVAPAQKAGLKLEDGLVDLLLRELGRSPADPEAAPGPGALPLLSHALLATWERRRQSSLTINDYQESGGIDGAVARTAGQVYDGLNPAQQRTARQIFLRLVHIADDTGDTRRRAGRPELLAGHDAQAVLDRFVGQRLITATADGYEIVHEALLLAWPRLRGWLDADRAGLRTQRRLAVAAEAWRDAGRDPNALLSGVRLAEATEWAGDPRHDADLNALEREFLTASADHAAAQAGLARRRVRRRQQLTAVLAVLCLLTTSLAVFTWRQRSLANKQRDQAVSRRVATEAGKLRAKDVALAGQLSLAAYRVARTPEARSSLLEAYSAPSVTRVVALADVMQSVAFTRDGRTMATAGADRLVRLWKVADRGHPAALGRPLRGHPDTVYAVAFSPDGRWLASGGGGGAVFLWSVTRPSAPGRRLTGPGDTVYSVAFSPDGRTLAAGGADKSVRLWSLDQAGTPAPLGRPLTGPAGFVQSVAFSPDGRTLAAGSADGTARLWDLRDRARPRPLGVPLTGPAKTVFSIAFSPDGRTLAAGSADYTVRLWSLADRAHPARLGAPLTGAKGWINSVAFGPDGRTLAAASSDGKVWIWDVAGRTVTASLPHPGPVTGVVFPRSGVLATSAADGVARMWDLPGPVMGGPGGAVFSATFDATGHTLAIAGDDDTVAMWNVTDPRRPSPLGPPIRDATRSGTASGASGLSPDGRTLAVGGVDGRTQLWDVTRPAHPVPLPVRLTGPAAIVQGITFSPDGRFVVVGGNDRTERLWDVTDPRAPVRVDPPMTGPGNYAYQAVFSPDGHTVAFGSADRIAWLWDVTDPRRPRPLARLTGHGSYVFTVAFSADGRILATGGADNTVLLWDIADRSHPRLLPARLTGPTNYVYSLAYDHTGRMLAAAAGDGTVWLWDVADPRRPRTVATLTGSPDALYIDAFDPKRPVLVTGGADRSVRLWNTDPGQVAALVCAVAGTPITRAEWSRYLPGYSYRPPCGR